MEKINLKRLNSVIKKNSIEIIIVVFLFTMLGCFFSYNLVKPKYKSTSTLLLTSNSLNKNVNSLTQTDINLNQNLISTYGQILISSNVLNNVINNLNLDITIEELKENVKIKEIEDTQIIEIEIINENPNQAKTIAEELNKVFIEEIKQIYGMNNINIIDEPSLEIEPYNINHLRDIVVFFVMGIIFSILMISVIYLVDTTIKIEQDIEEYVGANVIGTVPIYKLRKDERELIVENNGKSVILEALKTIRTNISFTKTKGDTKAILFTSCNSQEGKSWISSNIAVEYALSNKNVIIVDADMRKGRQHDIFRVDNGKGLSNCLNEIKNNEDYETLKTYIKETSIPKVHIITIGVLPPNPSELLLSNKINDVIHMLKCVYDIVIIDGTPCNLVSDSIPLSRIVDTTVLVAESRKTKIEDLRNVVKSINNVNGKIEGVILNKKEINKKQYGSSYYYGDIKNNTSMDIVSNTVDELIANRRENIEDDNEEIEQIENEDINNLTKKLENLEDKFSKIMDKNEQIYRKTIEDINNIYGKDIDKQKLAEEIKENIIKNELAKKIEELNYTNDIKQLSDKVEMLDYTKDIKELADKVEMLDYKKNIKELTNKVEGIESSINSEIENKINKIVCEVKEILNKDELIEKIYLEIESIKMEQDEKINRLNYKNQIIQLANKINQIEEIINNKNTEENISKLLIEMKKENNQNSQKLDSRIKENERKLEEINNASQINEIINQLKQIDDKYENLVNEVKQYNESKQENNKKVNKGISNKDNIIELNKFKDKLNKKKKMTIKCGEEIEYEKLLDFAVEIYDLRPEPNGKLQVLN